MFIHFFHKFVIFFIYFFGVFAFTVYLYTINAINILEHNILADTASTVKLNYDVIIVGGGTAGLTIAAGLSPKLSVLIIESGNDFCSTKTPFTSHIARFVHNIPIVSPLLQLQDAFDWQHRTVPQSNGCYGLANNVSYWPMGRGFGGTQLINNMLYHRGHENDFRTWFTSSGSNSTYNYTRHIEPYFEQFESFIEIDNLMHITHLSNILERATRYLTKFEEILTSVFVAPKVLQFNGRRWTVADSYRQLNSHTRHKVILNADVNRILFDENGDQKSNFRAIGVNFRAKDQNKDVYASEAIILAAGTIGSPVILQKSGIGPRALYSEFGGFNKTQNVNVTSKLRLHMPAVGANLQDHITTGLDLIVLNETLGFEPWQIYSPRQLIDYVFHGKGALTTTGCEVLAFIRTKIEHDSIDASTPDLGFIIMPIGASLDAGVYMKRVLNINERTWQNYFKPLIGLKTMSILPIVLHPRSRGTVRIQSTRDDALKVTIDPKYFSHPADVEILVTGLQIIVKLIDTLPFKAFGAEINRRLFPGCEHEAFNSDPYWRCYVRHLTLTAYHPVGTCRMGTNGSDSVVDPITFQVHNVNNLYVCDASVMPGMPSANPQATVGMLAMKFVHNFNARSDRIA